jgi:hypothetical protein
LQVPPPLFSSPPSARRPLLASRPPCSAFSHPNDSTVCCMPRRWLGPAYKGCSYVTIVMPRQQGDNPILFCLPANSMPPSSSMEKEGEDEA